MQGHAQHSARGLAQPHSLLWLMSPLQGLALIVHNCQKLREKATDAHAQASVDVLVAVHHLVCYGVAEYVSLNDDGSGDGNDNGKAMAVVKGMVIAMVMAVVVVKMMVIAIVMAAVMAYSNGSGDGNGDDDGDGDSVGDGDSAGYG